MYQLCIVVHSDATEATDAPATRCYIKAESITWLSENPRVGERHADLSSGSVTVSRAEPAPALFSVQLSVRDLSDQRVQLLRGVQDIPEEILVTVLAECAFSHAECEARLRGIRVAE